MRRKIKEKKFSFRACALKDNGIIFTANNYNFVGRLDFGSNGLRILTQIPEYGFLKSDLTGKIMIWKESVVFLPCHDDKIRIWDHKVNSWYAFEVEKEGNYAAFFEGFIENNILYAISSCGSRIVKLDLLKKDKLEYIKVFDEERDTYFGIQGARKGSVLYMPDYEKNQIMRFNMEDDSFCWISIPQINVYPGFISLINEDDYLWIACAKGKEILRMDCRTQKTVLMYSDKKNISHNYFLNIFFEKELGLIAPSGYLPEILYLQENNISVYGEGESGFCFAQSLGNGISVIADANGNIKIFSNGKCVNCIKCKICLREISERNKSIFWLENPIVENERFAVDEYLEIMKTVNG